jgi:hypothetical protein
LDDDPVGVLLPVPQKKEGNKERDRSQGEQASKSLMI